MPATSESRSTSATDPSEELGGKGRGVDAAQPQGHV